MSNTALLTFIQNYPLSESMPHMLEVIKRIEADKEAAEGMEGLLALCYYEMSRFNYNQFVNQKKSGSGAQAISYGEKLRKASPTDKNATATLQFQINIHRLNKNWEDMRKSLETALNGIKEGLYPPSKKSEWLEEICYSYATERMWVEGRARFIEAYESTFSSNKLRNLAAIYLIQSYQESKEAEKALAYIPELQGAKEARYDPNLNLALFKLGNQFSEKGEYSSANYMYFLCLTIETITEYNQAKFKRLEARNLWYRGKETPIPPDLERETESLRKYIQELEEQTSYTGPLKYYRARNLERMGRKYDAFFAYLRLIHEHPEHPNSELFHFTAFNQADDIGYLQDALDLGESYLVKSDYVIYRKETIVKLISNYFTLENYDRVFELGEDFVENYPNHRYGNNVVHFMGFGYMRTGQIDKARTVLGGYLKKHPEAPMAQSAHYWVGLGDVIEQNFEEAIQHFDSIIENYPDGSFFIEARFRRAVCDFGIGDYEAAKPRFDQWVADYPDSHLRGEAEVFLGDIDAYYAKVESALAHYALTETFTTKMNLVDHAYFESVRLLEANDRFEDMITILNQYMERFQDTGNLSRAIFKIGQAYENTGQPELMIRAYYGAIERFGNNKKAEGVDEIFETVVKKYKQFDTYYNSTIQFIERLLNNEAFRLEMADDRKKLHLYRMKNPDVEETIIDSILRNPAIREGLATRAIPLTEEEVLAGAVQQYETSILPESQAYLETQLAEFQAKLKRFPSESEKPEKLLATLYATAKAEAQRTLELRLLAAFDKLGLKAPEEATLSINDFPNASPATLAWMATSLVEKDPELAAMAIDRVLYGHADSLAVPDALNAQAQIAYNKGQINESIEILDQISDRFPTWPSASKVSLRTAKLFMESKQYAEALERYLAILQVRDWRGAAWAEACYQIGRSYEHTNETLKAHGFYERTYLSYRQFPEWAGKAYYRDGLILEEMAENESAKSVYEKYLQLPDAETLADYEAVRKRHEKLL